MISDTQNRVVQVAGKLFGDRYRGQKKSILGIGVSTLDRASFLAAVEEALRSHSRLTISFVNSHSLLCALRDPQLTTDMNAFDIMLVDGQAVVYGSRLLHTRIPERLGDAEVGPDIFRLCEAGEYKTFLFGGAPGVAGKAVSTLRQHYPALPIVGALAGGPAAPTGLPGWYEPDYNDTTWRRINEARPDILWVSLPIPAHQRWIWQNAHRLTASVIVSAGGYFYRLAERMPWYPPWIHACKFNWLYRLWREPRRLWRRYSLELLEFGWLLLCAKFQALRGRV